MAENSRPTTLPVQKMDNSVNWVTLDIEKDGRLSTVVVTENMANLLFSETVDQNTRKALIANIELQQTQNQRAKQQGNNTASTSKLPVIDHNANELLHVPNNIKPPATSSVLDPDQETEELHPSNRKDISGLSETSKQNLDNLNSSSKWTQAAEKLLLVRHKDLEDSKVPIKQKWKKISDDMNSLDYYFTPEQCRLKLKSLKEKYKRNKKKNNKSGESPADSDDEELEEIFEKLPDMNPVCLIESNPSKSQTPTDQENIKRPRTTSPLPDVEGKGNKRARRSVYLMKSFFEEAMEKLEEAVERRHKEKIETINSLVGVLKDLVKK